ncbi:MAG: hypothetical protein U0903_18960 [Planctomycetales bacterium]
MNKPQTSENLAFERATDPVFQLLTVDQLRQLQELHADPDLHARIEVLALKANEGDLTSDERQEYLGYIQANSFLAVVQARARKHLEPRDASP